MVRSALGEAALGISSLASLHAELHDLESGQTVDLSSLFDRVGNDLKQLLPEEIALSISVSGHAAAHLASSLVLIVNEFVSNSVKHGFANSGGKVEIIIEASDDDWSVICRDNGLAGEADAERAASATGLGTRIIHSVAASLGAVPVWSARDGGMELKVMHGGRVG